MKSDLFKNNPVKKSPSVSVNQLILASALFFMSLTNFTFYSQLLTIYPLVDNLLFVCSVSLVFYCLLLLLLSCVGFRKTIKPTLIFLFILSANTAYFMDSYQVIIDDLMIQNVVQTNIAEANDLVSFRQLVYFIFIAILPSIVVWKISIVEQPIQSAIWSRLKMVLLAVTLVASNLYLFSDNYASFFRNHKQVRLYSNPGYPLYSTFIYIKNVIPFQSRPWQQRGMDAVNSDPNKRQLLLLIVGETVRADHLSLNGYSRKTTPRLEQLNAINFTQVESCGTSTAVSVPCMFSLDDEAHYDKQTFLNSDNILDVVQRSGASVLWLDNNSSSKGAADRVEAIDYRDPDINPACDNECRDIGMLSGLSDYLRQHPKGDILIVLHQMGNHGPAYYKRYPPEFEAFKPVCRTNQLEQCEQSSIVNGYDNAILYTDYFLSEAISWLKVQDQKFETSMFYVSDHGESLGENGIYLHGMPKLFAPESQTHIPMILWLGDQFDEQRRRRIENRRQQPISHDNMTHTILGLLNIKTKEYQPALDISR